MFPSEVFLKSGLMFPNIPKGILLFITVLVFGCVRQPQTRDSVSPHLKTDTTIRYAKRFAISSNDDLTLIYIFGNHNNRDTTALFAICKDTTGIRKNKHITYVLKTPCKKIAALSSIYATMFCELGSGNSLAAIDNIDYVNNPEVISLFNRGELKELARMPQVDIEQTVALKPDMIFTFGMGDWSRDLDRKLVQTGIPVAVSVDHLEETPLARAEWIKFFACFVDKRKQADSIFAGVEKQYFALRELAQHSNGRPTVFNEIKYSDAWYMPGGKSFMAQLLNDAGADYLWKHDDKAGSLPLSFEQVYSRAKDADYWINLSTLKTKKELLGYEPRYAEFNAFKKGHLYNNNKVANNFGYSSYWETGMIHPDRILSDLILIFHPELRQQVGSDFYYYRRLD